LSVEGSGVRADTICVAAGRSSRMGGTDKLAVEIGGRPLLAWTLDALAASPAVDRIVVVTSEERRAEVAAASWLPSCVIDVVPGGARRQESVRAGFLAFDRHGAGDDQGVVLVHDAARPLVEPGLVSAVADAVARYGAAIPVVPVAETLKRIDGDSVGGTVERNGLAAAQTPQGARRDIFRDAWRRFPADGPDTFTDEAALLEACSIAVHAVPGDPGNIKVTLPADLRQAALALGTFATAAGRTRTGFGHDSHPFGPGMPLRLGGVAIKGAPRLVGHSDGDAALHAVCDALLGATGLGDLGRIFPADSRTPAGIDSGRLVEEVRGRVAAAGWRPATVDITIVAARPKLAAHLDPMRDAIAGLLGLDPSAVNVKASTGNLDGADGAGRSVSALAIATVEAAR
jgi:2-C-methyl-D-erythritol 4-phosphate cytidylyltransferase/2-C-methyl-D-erythritol 2,4-cyclodiphosphate synthase